MQSLWNETQYNPLGHRYFSCVPFLLGEGQAMLYSFASRTEVHRKIPGVPFGTPPFNYLRENMVKTLDEHDVEFDLLIQVQTDPHRMQIEDASVRWPERLSRFIPAARTHIPKQKFDTPSQFEFTKYLKFNPWHYVPEHRPLGNQESRPAPHVLLTVQVPSNDERCFPRGAYRRRGIRLIHRRKTMHTAARSGCRRPARFRYVRQAAEDSYGKYFTFFWYTVHRLRSLRGGKRETPFKTAHGGRMRCLKTFVAARSLVRDRPNHG